MLLKVRDHKVWKWALAAALFSITLPNVVTISQPISSSLKLDQDTVVVCLYNLCDEDRIQHVAHLPRFETLEAAKQALEPRGGGTILLAPGAFRVTLEWSGNWTLKGLGIPEAVVLSPKEKPLISGFGFNKALNLFGDFPQVAMLLVKANSMLRLENVTLQDDYLAPIVSADNRSVNEERQRFASYALFMEESALVSINNARILNWTSPAIGASSLSRLSIENSEFIDPANSQSNSVIYSSILAFKSDVILRSNHLNHFSLSAWQSVLTLEDNELFKSRIWAGLKVSVKNNRFVDALVASRFTTEYGYSIGFAVSIGGDVEIIGNTFEVKDQGLQDLIASGVKAEGLLLASQSDDVVVRDNIFRGYSAGVSTLFGVGKLELANNLFDGNQVGFELQLLGIPATKVLARNNRFLNHPQCAIEIEKREDPQSVVIDGVDNEFQGNGQDVCPAGFPLPPGFVKPNAESDG